VETLIKRVAELELALAQSESRCRCRDGQPHVDATDKPLADAHHRDLWEEP
jgi:hypothetical protein